MFGRLAFILALCLTLLVLGCGESGESGESKEDLADEVIGKYGCTWVLDTYASVAVTGRDSAVLHVANWIGIKYDGERHVTFNEALGIVERCERQGH